MLGNGLWVASYKAKSDNNRGDAVFIFMTGRRENTKEIKEISQRGQKKNHISAA